MQLQEGDPKTYSCKPMNDGLLLRVMTQVVQGLRYLHSQNIIHGDIKPQVIQLMAMRTNYGWLVFLLSPSFSHAHYMNQYFCHTKR